MLILAGCSSSQSAKYKEAGCLAIDQMSYDLAAKQFNLAAENGDPEAVAPGIASQNFAEIYRGFAISLEEMEAVADWLGEQVSVVKTYCGIK